MTKRHHIKVGVIIGFVANYALRWFVRSDISVGFILSIILGVIGAILPDVLEPPKSKWHRKFFHSKILLIIILFAILIVIGFPWLNGALKAGLLIVLISYLSHLIMDSRTPAGLPFLNRK